MAIVVPQLDAEAPDVTVDDVALGHEILPPNAVEDVLPRDDPPGAACEEVEQALLMPLKWTTD